MAQNLSSKVQFYRQVAVVTAVGLILLGCLVILKPFIPALLLAAIFCLSTWPAFQWLETKLNGRSTFAAALMTVALAICFVVPLAFLGSSLAESFRAVVAEISPILQNDAPLTTPLWIKNLPWMGEYFDRLWVEHASDKKQLIQIVRDHSGPISDRLIATGASIGHGVLDISLGIVIAFFFFQRGQSVVANLRNLIANFGGPKSIRLLHVCANTVIGVVYGILGTALVLAALATIGFWIAQVPGAPLLGLLTFLVGIIPGGPPFVLAPVTAWLFLEGHQGAGAFMALWSFVIVAVLDMMIRPFLIARGSKIPLLLVLLGVFGGVASFGFIGLFIGPALLAIASALVREWSKTES